MDTMMAKRRPPTGPARARPKSRPMVDVAVAMSNDSTRKYEMLARTKRTRIKPMLLLIMRGSDPGTTSRPIKLAASQPSNVHSAEKSASA